MPNASIDVHKVRSLLEYDQHAGVFVWRRREVDLRGGWNTKFAGKTAGWYDRLGYLRIKIDGDLCQGHRLAWLYVHGEWPSQHIDHIDGNPSNNAIINLRDVPRATNNQNIKKRTAGGSPSLPLGVTYLRSCRSKPYRAAISVSGKSASIGVFATAEEAHAAYLAAKREMHAGCTI